MVVADEEGERRTVMVDVMWIVLGRLVSVLMGGDGWWWMGFERGGRTRTRLMLRLLLLWWWKRWVLGLRRRLLVR